MSEPTDHTTAEGVDLDEAIEAATTARLAHRLRTDGPVWSCECGAGGVGILDADRHLDAAAVRAAAPIIRRPVERERNFYRLKVAQWFHALGIPADADADPAEETARLRSQHKAMREQIDEDTQRLTALRARLADAERERDEARANADDLRARLADTLSKLLDAATPGGAPMAEPKDLDEAVKAARAAFDSECSKIGRVLDDPDAAENQPWRAAVAAALNRVIVERDEARDDLAVANAHVGALRARMAKLGASDCTCQAWPPEGPSPECEVHGAVRGLNEANDTIAALRARLADAEQQRDEARALAEARGEQKQYYREMAVERYKLLEAAESERDALQRSLADTHSELHDAQLALTALRAERDELLDAIQGWHQRVATLRARRARLADAERDALNRAAEESPSVEMTAWLRERAKAVSYG